MTNKGKHASQTPGTFYRDLAIMIIGILVVGAFVFFLLYLLADQPDTGPVAATTTTTEPETTTSEGVTDTTQGDTTTTTVASTSTTVAVRPSSEVTVVVLNSMGLDGAAGGLSNDLSEAGYQTLTPDNFSPEQDPSRIWYREDFAAEAAVLVEFLPGATVEPIPDETLQEGADVVVVLGTGYTE